MKIAVIGIRGYPYIYSGYETFFNQLMAGFQGNTKYEFHIYCHRSLFKNRVKVSSGVHLHYIPAVEFKSFSQLSHSLLSTIHSLFKSYDIVFYVNTANGPFGYFQKLRERKTIINTDGLEWLRPKWKGFGGKYFYWASKIATRSFDVLVADSEEMRKIYYELFSVNSEVIAYGANIRYSDGDEQIKQFGLAKDDYYLIVGRLIPDNNADLIVKGFLKSKTSKKLVIVGDVPYKDQYAQSIKENASEQIIFTGYVTNQKLLKELYANSYVYIHGHEYGGTNPSLLTALGYGCAIMALNTRFSKEVLKNGEFGVFFDKIVDSVTTKIDYLDQQYDEVKKYAGRARSRIIENYTWEKIVGQYDELFQKLVLFK